MHVPYVTVLTWNSIYEWFEVALPLLYYFAYESWRQSVAISLSKQHCPECFFRSSNSSSVVVFGDFLTSRLFRECFSRLTDTGFQMAAEVTYWYGMQNDMTSRGIGNAFIGTPIQCHDVFREMWIFVPETSFRASSSDNVIDVFVVFRKLTRFYFWNTVVTKIGIAEILLNMQGLLSRSIRLPTQGMSMTCS